MSPQVFRLPDLGEGLTSAEIVQWNVAVGEEVRVDQEVVVVETAKATVEVPCPYAGRVVALHGQEGQPLDVGEPLITVAEESLDAPAADPDAPGGRTDGDTTGGRTQGDGQPDLDAQLAGHAQYREEEQAGAASGAVLVGYGTGAGTAGRRRRGRRRRGAGAGAPADAVDAKASTSGATVADAPPVRAAATGTAAATADVGAAVRVISPLVRRLAAQHQVDLGALTPSRPDRIIRRRDVEAAMSATAPESPTPASPTVADTALAEPGISHSRLGDTPQVRTPLTGVRKVIADKLSASRREIPDATTWVDVDASGLMEARDALRSALPQAGIGVLALLARIAVAGLQRYPELNASVDVPAGEIVRHGHINLGFAAQSPRGLVVPVVHDAHAMSTTELAARLRELTEAAREGTLSPSQLTGGTFTVNNYGVFGVDGSTPIINHPEAAMLGVGRIVDKPWAHRGELAVRKVTQLSFTFDHRVCDGGTAGGYLRFVADCVENPTVLLASL